ncbi:response regulator transcription factor [Nitrospirillum pindoramense]|uniref:DNA-binding response OmpR family regulator n=1 Tax=Nitrospirillum amazonense TaxID=28077 RepID=A0A560H404_9PROT|nr:response regulator transcription factor [Nitrospirillum amazonense]TWB40978.1 DNA-binding response OmpR family regulator [Nitrospirillum amazonense]
MLDVLVVEDADGPRTDLVDYLILKGFQAAGAGTGAEALRIAESRQPTVFILDVGLPDCLGFDLAREFRRRHGLVCGIIMLTGHSSIDDKVEGLASGADIYLVKHTSMREVEANLRGLIRRLGGLRGRAAEPKVPVPAAGDWWLEAADWRLVAPTGDRTMLTATEFAFLARLMQTRGAIVSRAELIASLERPSMVHNDRNLDAVISRLRRKVLDASGVELPVAMVYGQGYVFRAPSPAE